MDIDKLRVRFTYHAPYGSQVTLVPESREKSLAVTHLEETIMWANATIARRERE